MTTAGDISLTPLLYPDQCAKAEEKTKQTERKWALSKKGNTLLSRKVVAISLIVIGLLALGLSLGIVIHTIHGCSSAFLSNHVNAACATSFGFWFLSPVFITRGLALFL